MKKSMMILGVLALVGCGKEETKPANKPTVTVGPVTATINGEVVQVAADVNMSSTVAVGEPATLGMRPDQFQEAFNKVLPGADAIHIKSFSVTNGSVNNVASYKFIDGVDMIAAVDKASGQMKQIGLTLGQVAKKDKKLNAQVAFLAINTTGAVLAPEQKELFSQTISQLFKEVGEKMDGKPVVKQVGQLKLVMMAHPEVGAMFSVEPINAGMK